MIIIIYFIFSSRKECIVYTFKMDDVVDERLQTYIQEVENREQCQLDDRKKLEDAVPFSEGQLRKMDSTLKRTTAFMKKLKNIGCVQLASILQDIDKVGIQTFFLIDDFRFYCTPLCFLMISNSLCDEFIRFYNIVFADVFLVLILNSDISWCYE